MNIMNLNTQEMLEINTEKPRLHQLCDDLTIDHNNSQDVKLCRICFATDDNLCSMKMDKNLHQAYGILTGLLIENEDNMPPYLCNECSHQLMRSIHFRNRSLRAHLLLLEILRKHDYITLDTIKSLNECQDDTSNLEVTHELQIQYDQKTVHIKQENVHIDEQICLRNEPRSLHIALNDIKKEYDCTISCDDPIDCNVHSTNLQEGTLLNCIKAEQDVYNEEDINEEDIINEDIMYSDAFEGEDGSENSMPVEEQSHKNKLSITKVKEVTKMKAPKIVNVKSSGSLLLYDQFCCDMCPYKTASDVKLLRHLKTHDSTKSYKESYTNNNVQKAHTREKRISCLLCTKTFSRKCGLQKHMKKHSGEKPYVCDVCQKGFFEKRDLQNHVRIHSGEKPFGCDLCKKSFSERGNLLRHIRIHSGERPFACKICKRSYNQKHHLKRHLTNHKII